MKKHTGLKTIFALMLILVIAVFFRFYKITEIPPGLYPDEAVNGVNALEANRTGEWKLYYPENNGREGLFINLQAISVKTFGAEPWALRIASGVFGALTVLGIFFLSRLLYGNTVALLASYLVAVSFWPVNFSRIGFRAIMLPFILVWAFYFLWLGIKKKNQLLFLIGGFIYGLGFHTYISWRVSPLILVFLFIALLFNKKLEKKIVVRWALVFTIGALVAASPLLFYYLKNPGDFMGRAAQVSIFNLPSPISALTESAIKTLGMFNVYGDGNWRHNFSGRPVLFLPLGVAFLIGIFMCVKKFKANYFLLAWFLVMLLPNFLAPEGAPHALRALGAMPAVFIIAAIGLVWIYNTFKDKFRKPYLWAFIFLAAVGVLEAKLYFISWARQPAVAGNFDERLTDIGDYLKNYIGAKYVIVNENGTMIKDIPVQAQPIIFLNFESRINYLRENDIKLLPSNLSNAVIVPTKPESEIVKKLSDKFPSGKWSDFGTFKTLIIKNEQ